MLSRKITNRVIDSLKEVPITALIGARQVGKTTLALECGAKIAKEFIYLDMESDADLAKLSSPEDYLMRHPDKLIIIDEVHRKPDLFRTLRSIVDKRRRAGEKSGHFLLLGSSSKDLLQTTSETLAGRIRYLELPPFVITEVLEESGYESSINKLWLRGGFPDSYLAENENRSLNWRKDFISTYVQQDIPLMGPQVSATRMKRFWGMIAHYHGSQVNLTELGRNLEVSHTTIRSYLDLLTDFYMVRQLQPWHGNTKKRLVKSPKIFIRDTGLLHSFLNINNIDDLLGNPIVGASWEGFIIEQIVQHLPDDWSAYYYRTSTGNEIDLILEGTGKERWAVEVKRSASPVLSRGFHKGADDIKATKKFVVYAGYDAFPLPNETEVLGLLDFLREL